MFVKVHKDYLRGEFFTSYLERKKKIKEKEEESFFFFEEKKKKVEGEQCVLINV